MKLSIKDEIFYFAETIINKPISEESEFTSASAIVKFKKKMYSLVIIKRKTLTYIDGIPMLVPVEKPDTPLSAIKSMFLQCFNDSLKVQNGISMGFKIVKNNKGFDINIQISEKQFSEPFWDLDDISESEKENRINKIMDKVVGLIKKAGVSGVSKTEMAYILKNYSPDIRDCIREGLEYSSFISKDFRSIENSKKKSLFYVYQNPVESEEDESEDE